MINDATADTEDDKQTSHIAAKHLSNQLLGMLTRFIFGVIFATTAVAQQSSLNHITLSIKDVTGAAIPGAAVKLQQLPEGVVISGKSDPAGLFAVGIQPGEYRLDVASPGFTPYLHQMTVGPSISQQSTIQLQISSYSGPAALVQQTDALPVTDQNSAQLTSNLSPIEVKVVVVSMFEIGADTGDIPGEYQYWVEREHLTRIMPFPQGYHDLRLNPQTGVLGLLTGIGTARATASVMALGLDPRFDFTHAYWLVAGIAGIDPHVGSLGSAVWADYIVDGDLGHEIDAREIPSTWTTGHVPLRKSTPYEQPRTDDNGLVYHLNPTLTTWAYNLTKEIKLPDTPEIATRRQTVLPEDTASPAHRPPFVLRGDILSASNFWHGKLMSTWAEDWVAYQTDGKGHYAVCGMEDTGTLEALTRLAHAGKVDINRVMVLRTASNYDQQRQGITASESLAETKITKYGAFLPSLDSAYRVGHQVVDSLVANWPQTRNQIPVSATGAAKE